MSDSKSAGAQDLAQIRSILVGAELDRIDARLAALDERLDKGLSALHTELEQRVSHFEEATRRELSALTDALRAHAAAGERRNDELRAALNERLATAADELRGELTSSSAALQTGFQATHEQLQAELAALAKSVRVEKMDRSDLASVLAEVAGRLGHGGANGQR